MGETQVQFILRQISNCEPVKPNMLCVSKIQLWDKRRIYIPIPKGGNKKEEGSARSQVSPKPNRANSIIP